jgi:hypothetical protein
MHLSFALGGLALAVLPFAILALAILAVAVVLLAPLGLGTILPLIVAVCPRRQRCPKSEQDGSCCDQFSHDVLLASLLYGRAQPSFNSILWRRRSSPLTLRIRNGHPSRWPPGTRLAGRLHLVLGTVSLRPLAFRLLAAANGQWMAPRTRQRHRR